MTANLRITSIHGFAFCLHSEAVKEAFYGYVLHNAYS